MPPPSRAASAVVATIGVAAWAWLMVGLLDQPTSRLSASIEARLTPPTPVPGSFPPGALSMIVCRFEPNNFYSGVQFAILSVLLASPLVTLAGFAMALWTRLRGHRLWPSAVGPFVRACFVVQTSSAGLVALLLFGLGREAWSPAWVGALATAYLAGLGLGARAWLSTLASVKPRGTCSIAESRIVDCG